MGKKSKRPNREQRDRPRTRNWKAPAVLPPDVHPHYDTTFVPIDIPKSVLEDPRTEGIQDALKEGFLLSWELGRKGTHIASRWVTRDGNEDILMSPDSNDDDYAMLTLAHTQQLVMYMGPSGDTDSEIESDAGEELLEEYTEEYLDVREYLADAQAQHREHPDTFIVPTISEIKGNVRIGDSVKVIHVGRPNEPGERFWCTVESISAGFSGRICAKVDNMLLFVPWPVGKKIEFGVEHVCSVMTRPRD